MKDEIKEILDDLKDHSDNKYINPFELISVECRLLLDYITNLQNKLEEKTYLYNKLDTESKHTITNLQEENEKYKRYVDETFLYTYEELQDKVINLQNENKKLKDRVEIGQNAFLSLNSKIDKAIEYIENELIPFGNEWHWDEGGISYMVDDVLNILQGSDKE